MMCEQEKELEALSDMSTVAIYDEMDRLENELSVLESEYLCDPSGEDHSECEFEDLINEIERLSQRLTSFEIILDARRDFEEGF